MIYSFEEYENCPCCEDDGCYSCNNGKVLITVDVDLDYTYHKGCIETWDENTGGSPAEDPYIELINIEEIQDLIDRELTEVEIEELENYILLELDE